MEDSLDLKLFRTMTLIRTFEATVDRIYMQGKLYGTTHLSIGQEAVAAGVCTRLQRGDVITSTHRGHGHNIALGGDINRMMAELLGRETGYGHGFGGSMHIADWSIGNLGANGIVAAGTGIAVGAALALQMQGKAHVAVAFSGDGALNEGIFHEALNLAAIWQLPVIFVVENNQYGMSASVRQMYRIDRLAERAAGYGIPGVTIDGNDVHAVMEATDAALIRARAGEGATLLEAVTYRHKGHSKNDAGRYRPSGELEAWKARDPIVQLRNELLSQGVPQAELDAIVAECERQVGEAITYAEKSPWPDPSTILGQVWAEGGETSV